MPLKSKTFIVDEKYADEDTVQKGFNLKVKQMTRKVVRNHVFEKAVLFLIVTNAAWIGIDVDWNDGAGGTVPPLIFTVVESGFCCCFTLEIILRVLTYDSTILFFKDPAHGKSNIFDLFLVSLMILEVWVMEAFSFGTNLHQFALIRLLRLMRLLRISRILMIVPELGMMVKSLKDAMRSVTSTLVLEIGIMYIVGVIFTQWAKEHENPCFAETSEGACFLHEYFGTITKSLVTLLQILVFDNTFVLIRPILADTWYMGCLLILFMVVGSWTVLNMLIGIICEIICTGTAEEKMRILEQRVKEVFSMIDLDGSGTVSRDEFNHHGVEQQLIKLGISAEIVRNAFDILDCDGSGHFDAGEFMSVVFKLLNPPQSQDIQVLHQKIGEIAAHINIQAFTSHSSKRLFSKRSMTLGEPSVAPCEEVVVRPDPDFTCGMSVGGPNVAPCEDVCMGPDPHLTCKSDDSIIHELRKAARISDSDFSAALQKEQRPVQISIANGQEDSHFRKESFHANATGIQIYEDNHPFAPEHDSTDPDVVADVPLGHDILTVSESNPNIQIQVVCKKLQQLGHTSEKVEEALELVHGTKLREPSETESIDCILKDAECQNFDAGEKNEADSQFPIKQCKTRDQDQQSVSTASSAAIRGPRCW